MMAMMAMMYVLMVFILLMCSTGYSWMLSPRHCNRQSSHHITRASEHNNKRQYQLVLHTLGNDVVHEEGFVEKKNQKVHIEIEYCPGCKWMLRSSWMMQELLSTFEADIARIALIPSSDIGTFTIRVDDKVLWDRRVEVTKGFREVKVLKQVVRDCIDPQRSLGHLDRTA